MASWHGQRVLEMLQSSPKEARFCRPQYCPKESEPSGSFSFPHRSSKAPFVDASYPFPGGFARVELVTHLGFRYPVSSEAPSSSQVQDTRFSSWEQGFESPWGHCASPLFRRVCRVRKCSDTFGDTSCQTEEQKPHLVIGGVFASSGVGDRFFSSRENPGLNQVVRMRRSRG